MKLPIKEREIVKKLDKEMSELETKASLNIAESKENIEFDLKLLDGFSDKYK
jgi:hypothetical protein